MSARAVIGMAITSTKHSRNANTLRFIQTHPFLLILYLKPCIEQLIGKLIDRLVGFILGTVSHTVNDQYGTKLVNFLHRTILENYRHYIALTAAGMMYPGGMMDLNLLKQAKPVLQSQLQSDP